MYILPEFEIVLLVGLVRWNLQIHHQKWNPLTILSETQVKKKKIHSVHVKYLALKPTVFSKKNLGFVSLSFNIFNFVLTGVMTHEALFVVVLLLGSVQLFVTPWTAAHQASLSFTISRSLLKLMSIESVMSSNHLVLCHPLLPMPSIFPSIMVFSDESVLFIRWPKYWSFSF